MATLESIRSLHEVTPFSNDRPDATLLRRAKGMLPTMKHVENGTPSMLVLEEQTVRRWNDRRKVAGKKPDRSPWDTTVFKQVIESDYTTGCRMFPVGEMTTLSHFLLRETPDNDRSFDLINFAASEKPGVSDMMVEALMQLMKRDCRMRLRNMVEQSH